MTTSNTAVNAALLNSTRIILAALEVGGGIIQDDHRAGVTIDATKENVMIVEWNGHLCPFKLGVGGCCLNPIYLDEITGDAHMSKWSVGPYFSDEQLRTSSVVVHSLDIVA